MKESINYEYNLNIENLEEYDNYYRFILSGIYFYFVPITRAAEEVPDIINCSKELKEKGILCHDIMLNREGKSFVNINNSNYMLLKINGNYMDEYALVDILEITNKLSLSAIKSKMYRNNWSMMWSSKIDYFEYQVSELGKNKKGILDSFSYYVGLAENAISYVNKTTKTYKQSDHDKITLAHRRIFYPNIKLNYLNPLSFIFDLEVRDVAEYIKVLFFSTDEAYNELELYLKLHKLTPYSYQMFYARLLYPSYYFDVYEKIMSGECNEEKFINIIEKAEDYEFFLKRSFDLISKYYPIEKVEWIANKKL